MELRVAWYMWLTSGEEHLANYTSGRILTYHPKAEIVAISDKTVPPSKKYYQSPVSKDLGCGDKFIFSRYRQLLELSSADLFVKVDPDSIINRKAVYSEADWFGQVSKGPDMYFTVGCGMGLRRNLIEKLLGLEMENTTYTYEKNGKVLLCEDFTLGHYLNKTLGIRPVFWKEVRLKSRFHLNLLDTRWAITHPNPVKDIQKLI